ncbi:DUF1906 domain-containing protein [Corynebacterium hylobatis]|uniref:DUF1906 domain-containing protein n=1 Tax=Corynebacterium hylobatis TaxID=1859290 RepID=A0A430HVK5_9CORY|nr:DUF1906 domain-containing protein [Corynebacterium hylobatis]RSZ61494.1 DUF1906 domain-containing protein [Corynebacterium hylobatis]
MNRRGFLRAAAVAVAAGAVGATLPQAHALGPVLGTVIDYSAGVPSAAAVKAAGHLGAVRYVSDRRPGAEWMLGKPVAAEETQDFANHGLGVASVYQYGKDATADWKQGAAGVVTHAPQAIAYHRAAGGPTGRPIYIAIDDNPTRAQYDNQIRPYLQAFQAALEAAGYQTGVYGNYNVVDWAVADGLGQYFWMHNWGSGGRIHPRTTLHQVRIDKDRIGGIGIDINNVYAQDWGQWIPGQAAPAVSDTGTISPAQIQQGIDALRNLSAQ